MNTSPSSKRLAQVIVLRLLAVALVLFLGCARPISSEQPTQPGAPPAQQSLLAEPTARSPNAPRRALLVGIEDYASNDAFADLKGPLNDVRLIKDVLMRRYGFKEAEIQMLTNAQATKAKLSAAFEQHLIESASPGSIAIFYFSGHGSRSYDSSKDESDVWDETLVVYDSDRQRANSDLIDDELGAWIERLQTRGALPTVIIDACHSGTATRGPTPRLAPDDTVALDVSDPRGSSRGASEDTLQDSSGDYVLISGSRADELSYEFIFGGETHGALTWFLTRALWQTAPDTSYQDLLTLVQAKVTAEFPHQHPQVEGKGRSRTVFDTHVMAAAPYVELTARGSELTLGAGAVHGISKGAQFAAYPFSSRQLQGSPLATVEVETVAAISAKVRIVSQTTSLPERTKAVQRRVGLVQTPLQVRLASPAPSPLLSALAEKLAQHPQVKLVSDDARYDVLVEATGPESLLLGHGTDQGKTKQVASGRTAIDQVATWVLGWAKWHAILGIDNPQFNGSNSLIRVTTDPPTRQPAGSAVSFTVYNTSDKRLYFSLLDLSFDGSVTQIYPPGGAQEFIEPHATFRHTVTSCLPRGWEQPGIDVVKVIATQGPHDLSFLQQSAQSGIRARSGANSLEDALAWLAMGQRGALKPQGLPANDWSTHQSQFEILPSAQAQSCN